MNKTKNFGGLILALLLSANTFATEYVVKYKNFGILKEKIQQHFTNPFLAVTDMHARGNLVAINVEDHDTDFLMSLLDDKNIEYVVKNFEFHTFSTPMNSVRSPLVNLKKQWALETVNAAGAWSAAGNKGKSDVVIAVIDTGVDHNHESLKDNMVPGYDYADNDSDPFDKTKQCTPGSGQPCNPGHGTHCAGIAAATGQVDGGTSGLVQNVKIMPLRFLTEEGGGNLMNGVKAVDHAIDNGAHVISASWGAEVGASQAQPVIDAVKRASDAGVTFVAAAGNSSKNNDKAGFYPANAKFDNVITVAASQVDDKLASFSNHGDDIVDIAAPGHEIISTIPMGTNDGSIPSWGKDPNYISISGTSMAAPLISGMTALLKSQDMSLTGAQMKAIMQLTAAQTAVSTACNCRVDAEAAVNAVIDKAMYIVPAAKTVEPNGSVEFKAYNNDGTVTYKSTDASIATIDEATGVLKALKEGITKVEATDAAGNTISTLNIRIAVKPKQGGSCPLGNPAICQMACGIMPTLPFCN